MQVVWKHLKKMCIFANPDDEERTIWGDITAQFEGF
jgi:hypothetical protein